MSLNVYAENVASEPTAKPLAMIQRPGRTVFNAGSGEARAMWTRNGTLYVIRGTSLLSIASNGAVTTLVDTPTGRRVTFHNGYWLKIDDGTNEFAASAIDDPTSWEALDNAFERQLPGDLQFILSDHAEVLLMKSQSIAFWFESGAATGIPFDRVPQLVLQTGVVAPDSVLGSLDERVFFLGQQQSGTPMVFVLQGRQAQKISTPAVDNVIARSGVASDAYAFQLGWKGHLFYVLTLPGYATLAFDALSGLWSDWTRYPLPTYDVTHTASAYDRILGLTTGGDVVGFDDDVNTDAGTTMVRSRTTMPFEVRGQPFSMDWVELDCEMGGAALGDSPQVSIEISRDRGQTWSNPRYASLGATGKYLKRVKWDKLGFGREFVVRVSCSDDVRLAMTGLRAGVRVGRN